MFVFAQVMLQHMYESHYEADPAHRTPPIPTMQVKLRHSAERERELCYLAESTADERAAVKQKLLQAVLELEHALLPEHPVRNMVEGSNSNWMGNYIIKREFSEGSHHVLGISLPDLRSKRPAATEGRGQTGTETFDKGGAADISSSRPADSRTHEQSDSMAAVSVFNHLQAAASRLLHFFLKSVLRSSTAGVYVKPGSQSKTAAEVQSLEVESPDDRPEAPTCSNPAATTADPKESKVSSAVCGSGSQGGGLELGDITPELDSVLDEFTERILHTSCGEGWLVQPRIANMTGLEYRVYMLGGASAVSFHLPQFRRA